MYFYILSNTDTDLVILNL